MFPGSAASGHGGIRSILDDMKLLSTEAEGVNEVISEDRHAEFVNEAGRVGALLGLKSTEKAGTTGSPSKLQWAASAVKSFDSPLPICSSSDVIVPSSACASACCGVIQVSLPTVLGYPCQTGSGMSIILANTDGYNIALTAGSSDMQGLLTRLMHASAADRCLCAMQVCPTGLRACH